LEIRAKQPSYFKGSVRANTALFPDYSAPNGLRPG
jgi:hypothetical protein